MLSTLKLFFSELTRLNLRLVKFNIYFLPQIFALIAVAAARPDIGISSGQFGSSGGYSADSNESFLQTKSVGKLKIKNN